MSVDLQGPPILTVRLKRGRFGPTVTIDDIHRIAEVLNDVMRPTLEAQAREALEGVVAEHGEWGPLRVDFECGPVRWETIR